jgi:DNA-binding transcriptional MerR regulator
MAGERINKAAPLTASEKQKRYRGKKADEKRAAIEDHINRLRELFIEEIRELPPDELLKLIKLKDNPPEYPEGVTLKELSKILGISMYELKKLEAQGIIEPIKTADPSGLTEDEISRIKESGLTKDEFLRLIQFLDQEMTLSELSKKANIPLRKIEEFDRKLHAA